jgi:hypothetical protein
MYYSLLDLEYARRRLNDRMIDLAVKASSDDDVDIKSAKATLEFLDATIAERRARMSSGTKKSGWSFAALLARINRIDLAFFRNPKRI